MDRSEIEAKMNELLVEELGLDADKIAPEARFEEDLEVDSLGVVELLMALEDNFDVQLPDDEAESIGTLGQAVAPVFAQLARGRRRIQHRRAQDDRRDAQDISRAGYQDHGHMHPCPRPASPQRVDQSDV